MADEDEPAAYDEFDTEISSQHPGSQAASTAPSRSPSGQGLPSTYSSKPRPARASASPFTSPTPAIQLLERFGIKATTSARSVAHAAQAVPTGSTRRPPVAPPQGKETPWTPNGPNDTHVPYMRVNFNPLFADLLDPKPARTPTSPSPSLPAWRPGGGGGGSGTARAGGGAGGSYASRAAALAAARARATSRQTALTSASPPPHPPAGSTSSAGRDTPTLLARQRTAPRLAAAGSGGSGADGGSQDGLEGAAAAGAGPSARDTRGDGGAGDGRGYPPGRIARLGSAALASASVGSGGKSPRALSFLEWADAQTRLPSRQQPKWRTPSGRSPVRQRSRAIVTAAAAGGPGSGGLGGSSKASTPRTPQVPTPAAGATSGASATASPAVRLPPPGAGAGGRTPGGGGGDAAAAAAARGRLLGSKPSRGLEPLLESGSGSLGPSREASSVNLSSSPSITTLAQGGRPRPSSQRPSSLLSPGQGRGSGTGAAGGSGGPGGTGGSGLGAASSGLDGLSRGEEVDGRKGGGGGDLWAEAVAAGFSLPRALEAEFRAVQEGPGWPQSAFPDPLSGAAGVARQQPDSGPRPSSEQQQQRQHRPQHPHQRLGPDEQLGHASGAAAGGPPLFAAPSFARTRDALSEIDTDVDEVESGDPASGILDDVVRQASVTSNIPYSGSAAWGLPHAGSIGQRKGRGGGSGSLGPSPGPSVSPRNPAEAAGLTEVGGGSKPGSASGGVDDGSARGFPPHGGSLEAAVYLSSVADIAISPLSSRRPSEAAAMVAWSEASGSTGRTIARGEDRDREPDRLRLASGPTGKDLSGTPPRVLAVSGMDDGAAAQRGVASAPIKSFRLGLSSEWLSEEDEVAGSGDSNSGSPRGAAARAAAAGEQRAPAQPAPTVSAAPPAAAGSAAAPPSSGPAFSPPTMWPGDPSTLLPTAKPPLPPGAGRSPSPIRGARSGSSAGAGASRTSQLSVVTSSPGSVGEGPWAAQPWSPTPMPSNMGQHSLSRQSQSAPRGSVVAGPAAGPSAQSSAGSLPRESLQEAAARSALRRASFNMRGSRASYGAGFPTLLSSVLSGSGGVGGGGGGDGAGPPGPRGSTSGASTFSALSGPQAGDMYNYPSHGYVERAAAVGLWEASMLYDLDLYDSIQLQGFPTAEDYDDPTYALQPQLGVAGLQAAATAIAAAAATASSPPSARAPAPSRPGAAAVLQGIWRPLSVSHLGAAPGFGRREVSPVDSSATYLNEASARETGPVPTRRGPMLPRRIASASAAALTSRLRAGATARDAIVPVGCEPWPSGTSVVGGDEARGPRVSESAHDTAGRGDGTAGPASGARTDPGAAALVGVGPGPPRAESWSPEKYPSTAPRNYVAAGNLPDSPASMMWLHTPQPATCPPTSGRTTDAGAVETSASEAEPAAVAATAATVLRAPRPQPMPALSQFSSGSRTFPLSGSFGGTLAPEPQPGNMEPPHPHVAFHGDLGYPNGQPLVGPHAAYYRGWSAGHAAALPPTIPEEIFSHPLSRASLASPSSSTAGSSVMRAMAGAHLPQEPAQQEQITGRPVPGMAGVAPPPHTGGMAAGSYAPVLSQSGSPGEVAVTVAPSVMSTGSVAGIAAQVPSSSPASAAAPSANLSTSRPAAAAPPVKQVQGWIGASRPDLAVNALRTPVAGGMGPAFLPQEAVGQSAAAAAMWQAAAPANALPQPGQASEWQQDAAADLSFAMPSLRSLMEPASDSTARDLPQPIRTPQHPPPRVHRTRTSYQALAAGLPQPPLPYVPPYTPPSLQSIQRLLESDLPTPAIAAAVAVLAGSLPQASWPPEPLPPWRQEPTGPGASAVEAGATRPPWLAPGRADLVHSPGAPAGGSAGAGSPGLLTVNSTAANAASGTLEAAVPAVSTGATAMAAAVEVSGQGGPAAVAAAASRSYAALLTLAGERGMPPKPLLEDAAQLEEAVAAADLRGGGAGGRPQPMARGGNNALVDGPLGRAVRLLAQSMLIVLAGAAGATAAASSANAIFIQPEDLPYKHGTSIQYSKQQYQKRHKPSGS